MCSFEVDIEGKATAPASAPYLRPVGNSGLLAKYSKLNASRSRPLPAYMDPPRLQDN